jgi:hypothetical protein
LLEAVVVVKLVLRNLEALEAVVLVAIEQQQDLLLLLALKLQ